MEEEEVRGPGGSSQGDGRKKEGKEFFKKLF